MPRVSVNWGSNRPGGVDVVLAGLRGQTFKDFEVVFVDGLYHERHALVLEEVKRVGLEQPFFHVPNHRYRPDIWGATCAGYNTGFALSDGDVVVMLLDYGYAASGLARGACQAPGRWPEDRSRLLMSTGR
jgi:predicted HAD superfamily hydrolase